MEIFSQCAVNTAVGAARGDRAASRMFKSSIALASGPLHNPRLFWAIQGSIVQDGEAGEAGRRKSGRGCAVGNEACRALEGPDALPGHAKCISANPLIFRPAKKWCGRRK